MVFLWYNFSDNARRTCLPNGQWFYNPTTNRSWTDYRDCIKPLPKSIILVRYELLLALTTIACRYPNFELFRS